MTWLTKKHTPGDSTVDGLKLSPIIISITSSNGEAASWKWPVENTSAPPWPSKSSKTSGGGEFTPAYHWALRPEIMKWEICVQLFFGKKNWQYIVHDIRGYSPGFQSHPIKSCLVSRDSQYLENRGYLSTCSSHKSTEWRITGVLRVPQMARQKRS